MIESRINYWRHSFWADWLITEPSVPTHKDIEMQVQMQSAMFHISRELSYDIHLSYNMYLKPK